MYSIPQFINLFKSNFGIKCSISLFENIRYLIQNMSLLKNLRTVVENGKSGSLYGFVQNTEYDKHEALVTPGLEQVHVKK